VESKRGKIRSVKYWEIIADNLKKAGWSWGCVATVEQLLGSPTRHLLWKASLQTPRRIKHINLKDVT
jgi:hypothetical protein